MRLVFDIDGVVCATNGLDYEKAFPMWGVIERINRHHEQGDIVILYTARGAESGIDYRALTERQLLEWGVEYDVLRMDKPAGDIYIDDRAINVKDW